jgi:hypothetical protein
MPDKETLDRFGDAVEEKKQQAKEASEQPRQEAAAGPGAVDGDQRELTDHAHEQDDRSARSKNSRHGKVTAENWNQ